MFYSMKPPLIDLSQCASDHATWLKHREEIREGIGRHLGCLPCIPKTVEAEVLWRQDHTLGVVEKLRIDNGTETGMPAWYAAPKNVVEPGPAVLWCHWHGGEYEVGKDELFENRHTPESPVQCFLEMGMSVLCVDAFGFGERHGAGAETCEDFEQEGEHSLFKFFLWQGSTLWGRILWDDRTAFRYLQQRREVDAKRIAAAGMSMGATRTQWLMAFEEELVAGVAIACMVRYRDLVQARALNLHGMYFFVPGLMEYCDLESILALAAPRPLLCMNGMEDGLSPLPGIRTTEKEVSRIYELYNKAEAFRSELIQGVGHGCSDAMWQSMKDWVSRWLSKKINPTAFRQTPHHPGSTCRGPGQRCGWRR
jgi:dienelactone hydrolase